MRRLLPLLTLGLLMAAACAQSQPDQSHGLVLGAIYPLTGPQAQGGQEELAGVMAALRLAQSTGVLKQQIRLQVVDATSPQAASAAVDELVRDHHVPAILGTYGSTLSAAASARAEELKTVYWETGAVADPITARRQYVFRTVATGSSGGASLGGRRSGRAPRSACPQSASVWVRARWAYTQPTNPTPASARRRFRKAEWRCSRMLARSTRQAMAGLR